jgi:hypothetical protein
MKEVAAQHENIVQFLSEVLVATGKAFWRFSRFGVATGRLQPTDGVGIHCGFKKTGCNDGTVVGVELMTVFGEGLAFRD